MTNNEQQGEKMKFVVFGIGEEEYGVDVYQVRSIEKVEHITRVPNTPSFVKGVVNMRGVITPVIDLRNRFGLGEYEATEQTRMIIVAVEEMVVGLIVDSAHDVLDVDTASIEPPPEVVGGIQKDYLRGVAKRKERLLILLNLDKVLSSEEIEQMQQFEKTLS